MPAAPSSEGSEPQGPPTPASRVARARSTRSSRLRRRGSAVRPRVPAPLTADDLLDEDEDTGLAVDAAWDEDEDEEEQQQAVSSKQTGTPAALDDDEAAEEAAELQAMLAQARGDTPSVPAPADASTTATTSSTSTSTSSSNSSSKEWALWSRARAEGSRAGPVELPERSPMYLPVLTDEDLAADPPGHKSGYVAVIGKPNAGGWGWAWTEGCGRGNTWRGVVGALGGAWNWGCSCQPPQCHLVCSTQPSQVLIWTQRGWRLT